MHLKINTKALNFTLKDKDGKIYELEKINSSFIVIYFYPKDNTPGCTIEAREFSLALEKFENLDTMIIGISGGNEQTKEKFCDKNNLKIILLSDEDFKISKKYKVYGEKNFMGRKYLGIFRTTFILDKNKKIIKIYEKVNPKDHAQDVLDFIKK